jgi:hypothetical protein
MCPARACGLRAPLTAPSRFFGCNAPPLSPVRARRLGSARRYGDGENAPSSVRQNNDRPGGALTDLSAMHNAGDERCCRLPRVRAVPQRNAMTACGSSTTEPRRARRSARPLPRASIQGWDNKKTRVCRYHQRGVFQIEMPYLPPLDLLVAGAHYGGCLPSV